ncbi:MAG: PKD domain-containing protein [Bacteroidetes bacterium]|nr:PKD domain-containing protein [Bacteroidota bacterium]
MKKLALYSLMFFLALVYSCNKKKYPDSMIIDKIEAVFSFDGTIDGKPVSIKAGVDNYYMYSSYAQDTNGVYNFVGEFKQTDCNDCRNSLKIQINDFKISAPNEAMKMDSALVPKTYRILAGTNSYLVGFQSLFNKQAENYYWDFGDGTGSNETNPTHEFFTTGQYNVGLKITSANACESFIGNKQNIDVSNKTCKSYIGVTNVSGNSVSFIQTTYGGAYPYKYSWNFGDGDTSTAVYPVHNYLVSGSYPVTLKVTDANGVTTLANFNAVTQGDASSCAANYFVKSVNAVHNPKVSLSKVIITWTDENGEVYSSNNEIQLSSSYLDLLEAENFDNNENNQPTKKLKVKFRCMMYSGNKSVLIDNAQAIIAVAHK